MGVMNLSPNEKVTVYYNNITIAGRESGHIVHVGCPYEKLPWREATEYAEKKIDSGEWSEYLIPALNSIKTTFEDQDDLNTEEDLSIVCKCGNTEKMEGGPEELTKFYWEVKNYFICGECHSEVQVELNTELL